jgi:hypothetical protein
VCWHMLEKLTHTVHYPLFAFLGVALWQELVYHPHTLQPKDDAPNAECPPAINIRALSPAYLKKQYDL